MLGRVGAPLPMPGARPRRDTSPASPAYEEIITTRDAPTFYHKSNISEPRLADENPLTANIAQQVVASKASSPTASPPKSRSHGREKERKSSPAAASPTSNPRRSEKARVGSPVSSAFEAYKPSSNTKPVAAARPRTRRDDTIALATSVVGDAKQPSSHLLTAAIDVGTGFSGYAFAFNQEPLNTRMNKNWQVLPYFMNYCN